MRPLDFLSMAAVAGLLSWCAFDLFSRASDPYDITKPRQRIAPVGGITGHGEPWDVPTGLNQTSPKARGVAVNSHGIRDFSAPASPSFPASFAGSIATRNQDQEVTPAPGRIKPSSPVKPLVQTARGTTLSRAKTPKESNEENLSVSQAERSRFGQNQAASGSVLEPTRPHRRSGTTLARAISGPDRIGDDGNVGDQVGGLQRSRVGGRAVIKGEQASPKIGEWVKVEISTYSARYHGGRTATGERYDHHRGFTAATTRRANGWDLPRGSTWEVNYRGKTVVVRINDCGRHRPTKARLWLDLSGAAWRDLTGIAPSRKVARMRRVK